MSKRIDQTISVITKTATFIRSELESTDCVPVKVANSLCNKAIAETANKYHVGYSTISSKCIREIGFKRKCDFFNALIAFITRNKDNQNELLYTLLNHASYGDDEWYINRRLDEIL